MRPPASSITLEVSSRVPLSVPRDVSPPPVRWLVRVSVPVVVRVPVFVPVPVFVDVEETVSVPDDVDAEAFGCVC